MSGLDKSELTKDKKQNTNNVESSTMKFQKQNTKFSPLLNPEKTRLNKKEGAVVIPPRNPHLNQMFCCPKNINLSDNKLFKSTSLVLAELNNVGSFC